MSVRLLVLVLNEAQVALLLRSRGVADCVLEWVRVGDRVIHLGILLGGDMLTGVIIMVDWVAEEILEFLAGIEVVAVHNLK